MEESTRSTQRATHTLPDGTNLAHVLHSPLARESSPSIPKLAIIAHPWGRLGGSKNDHMVVALSKLLCEEGYHVVRFDCRGSGESEGSASWTASTEVEDFQTILNSVVLPLLSSIASPAQTAPIQVDLLLCGYSFGSLLASSCPPPPSTPQHSFRTRYLLLSYPLSVMFALTSFHSSRFTRMLEDRVKEGNGVCVVFGDEDQFSGVAKLRNWSRGLVERAEPGGVRGGEKQVTVVEIEGADHFWARGNDKRRALEAIRDWVNRRDANGKLAPRSTTLSAPPPLEALDQPFLTSSSSESPHSLSSSSHLPLQTDSEGYLSPSAWLAPPTSFPPSMPRSRSSSTTSTSSSIDSYDSEAEAREAQLQFEESLRQLQSLVNLVVVPWVSRYFGRKWSYYLFERYLKVGLGKQFWFGRTMANWFVEKGWR
ncbi:hypothetical protein JCM3765_001284 [Sporobolomyces pararoseus]